MRWWIISHVCSILGAYAEVAAYQYFAPFEDVLKKGIPSPGAAERWFTPQELREHDGLKRPDVFLAFAGIVFNVTAGEEFYGPEGHYKNMAGREIFRSVAEYEYDVELMHLDTEGLEERHFKEAEDIFVGTYLEKYPIVGRVPKIGKEEL
mmetsp:Transcript_62081/g.133931  ORF Transcript_62081/g.133931 Transcript_62081/m.133931 type:complete len:150 (-) Transcript_62081:32-481(-)